MVDKNGVQDITFVCCVESGFLETQTLLMIESLRRNGGVYKDLPILAITPRFGPPLSKSTRKQLDNLNVSYISFRPNNKFSWKAFLNKHFSMAKAEEVCESEFLCWLDSDLIFTSEPSGLFLGENEDFTACPSDIAGGSCGVDDPWMPIGRKSVQFMGLISSHFPGLRHLLKKRKCVSILIAAFLYRRKLS